MNNKTEKRMLPLQQTKARVIDQSRRADLCDQFFLAVILRTERRNMIQTIKAGYLLAKDLQSTQY